MRFVVHVNGPLRSCSNLEMSNNRNQTNMHDFVLKILWLLLHRPVISWTEWTHTPICAHTPPYAHTYTHTHTHQALSDHDHTHARAHDETYQIMNTHARTHAPSAIGSWTTHPCYTHRRREGGKAALYCLHALATRGRTHMQAYRCTRTQSY